MFLRYRIGPSCFFFFFNDTATTEIYTLSLHDALPIWHQQRFDMARRSIRLWHLALVAHMFAAQADRKSTRLNSSHLVISYAVFCLKKKKIHRPSTSRTLSPEPQPPCNALYPLVIVLTG